MARKSNDWHDEPAAMQSPFGMLAQLKKTSDTVESPVTTASNTSSAVVLPKVKSTRIERAQRSGKTMTVVSFQGNPTDDAKHAWLKMAKTKLGVGGTVEGENVILQGDQRERVCSISEK